MSAKNRADLLAKLHKFAKKDYELVSLPSNRSVLEHMLYGCCLEDSTCEAADEAFAKLQENFFDWNEVRVTTAVELSETVKGLTKPLEGAQRVRKTLQGIFEAFYQFDLEFLKKENLGKSIQQFGKFRGVSPFVVSYVAQNGLGGHSIPVDRSMLLLFYVLGIITEDEAKKGKVPGLERAIAKTKGIEFAGVVHPLAVAFAASPFSPAVREKLLKFAPDAAERFPKRGGKKKAAEPVAKKVAVKPAEKAKPEPKATVTKKASPAAKATKKPAAKKATTKKVPPKKTAEKKKATKVTKKKATVKKAPARRKK